MRLNVSPILALVLILLFSSSSIVQGKNSWDIWVDPNTFSSRTFTVSRDNMMIKMRVRVFLGGPVSAYILNETSYNLFILMNTSIVIDAYIGTKNISLGIPVTIQGTLGLQYYSNTTNQIEYYVVVDNMANSEGANVQVEMITTVPAPSVFLSLTILIPIAVLYHRKRRV